MTQHATLQRFGERIGIPGLTFDELSTCTLAIDDLVIGLQWLEEAHALLVYAPVGSLTTPQDNVDFYKDLLDANVLGHHTRGLTVGFSKDFDTFFLSGLIPERALDEVALENFMNMFVDQAQVWQAVIHTQQDGDTAELAAPPAAGIRV